MSNSLVLHRVAGGTQKKKKKQLLLASGLAQEVYQNFVDNTGLA
jgi:hypothetical protein